MSSGARLRSIASGLCGAFCSRNNDLDGYWSIGKLRLLADQNDHTTVSLDVLNDAMQPFSAEFAPMLAKYRRLLLKLADATRIRPEQITGADIIVDFVPTPWPRAIDDTPQCGDQFVLTVTISADGRTAGVMRHAGYCRPHNPAEESRSNRRASV